MDINYPAGYQAAYQGAAYFLQKEAGYLRIAGPDQANFLQRQTTNDLNALKTERALITVLTSPAGRVLDVFYLLQEPDSIGVITLPGRSAQTTRFLKSRIFFMDQVTLQDDSAQIAQIDLLGPGAARVIHQHGLERTSEEDKVVTMQIAGVQGRALALDAAFGLGYRLVIPTGTVAAVQDALLKLGAEPLDTTSYQILRIEAGLPEAGSELTEDYTPLEIGLQTAISDTKGCYTGQEVIARQITYDKVTQHLCGLRVKIPVLPGQRIWVDRKAVGLVTSSAVSPRFGPLALAIVKRPYHTPGTNLSIGTQGEAGVAAAVSELPFRRT